MARIISFRLYTDFSPIPSLLRDSRMSMDSNSNRSLELNDFPRNF